MGAELDIESFENRLKEIRAKETLKESRILPYILVSTRSGSARDISTLLSSVDIAWRRSLAIDRQIAEGESGGKWKPSRATPFPRPVSTNLAGLEFTDAKQGSFKGLFRTSELDEDNRLSFVANISSVTGITLLTLLGGAADVIDEWISPTSASQNSPTSNFQIPAEVVDQLGMLAGREGSVTMMIEENGALRFLRLEKVPGSVDVRTYVCGPSDLPSDELSMCEEAIRNALEEHK